MRLSIFFAIVLLLGACASQPLYAPARDSESVGYYATRLTENRYRVTFNGRINTPVETVKNYALLRAAELTVDNGYEWFEIVDRQASDNRSPGDPEVSISIGVGTVTGRRCFPRGCRIIGGPGYTGIGVSTRDFNDRRQSIIEIFMGNGEPAEPTAVYNAAEVLSYLKLQTQQQP